MGAKLDEAHAALARIAAALSTAAPSQLGEAKEGPSRQERKRQKNLERLYGGKSPLDQSIGKPYQPKSPPAPPRSVKEEAAAPRTLQAMALVEERSSTTFKSCKDRAMVSTAHLRHRLPKPWFVKPDKDNPTYPVRTDCRASLAGLGRAIQKDMANPDEKVADQVIRRVNSTTGGTRGRLNLRLWGTGRGGQRMETFRGKPGTPKRTDTLAKKLGISKKEASALHGVSTGRADSQKHTPPYSPPGGSKGPAGNREVPRHPLAHAKPSRKESGKKEKRQEKREAGKIERGQARIGR